jgi:hypothetical protein
MLTWVDLSFFYWFFLFHFLTLGWLGIELHNVFKKILQSIRSRFDKLTQVDSDNFLRFFLIDFFLISFFNIEFIKNLIS